jgi:hypothetical protein
MGRLMSGAIGPMDLKRFSDDDVVFGVIGGQSRR